MCNDLKFFDQLIQLVHLSEVGFESGEAAKVSMQVLAFQPTLVSFKIKFDEFPGVQLKDLRDSVF